MRYYIDFAARLQRRSGGLGNHMDDRPRNPVQELIGYEILSNEDGLCKSQLQLREDHLHGGRVVQGGIAFILADASMATCLSATLPDGYACTTIEMKISFLEAVREGLMYCEARLIRKGKRIAFLEAKVLEGERLVATATASFAILNLS